MIFNPFKQQEEVLLSHDRVKVLIAAKRAGKSEPCYVETIIRGQNKPNYVDNGRDPFLSVIVAPTENMLRRLVWPKFRAFARGFEKDFNSSSGVFTFKNTGSIVMGASAEKPKRIEGLKLNHVHITEAFQCSEHMFHECLARTSDTRGTITIEGSLGTNIVNPKRTWLYNTFKAKQFDGARVWEWATADNPYFPKEELARLKDTLDPRTYRQLFEICWDTQSSSRVYEDFDDTNVIRGYHYNPAWPTYCTIDWGWTHEMACLFFQLDVHNRAIYLFDEIVSSKMTLETLYDRIMAKPYKIKDWICDIAGNQEREQTGKSNVKWFKEKGIHFKFRQTQIQYGIPLVRGFIKDGKGRRNFFIDELRCPKSLDGMNNYAYPEKDGIITGEMPVKKDDDTVDTIRYFVVNIMDPSYNTGPAMKNFNRWSL